MRKKERKIDDKKREKERSSEREGLWEQEEVTRHLLYRFWLSPCGKVAQQPMVYTVQFSYYQAVPEGSRAVLTAHNHFVASGFGGTFVSHANMKVSERLI